MSVDGAGLRKGPRAKVQWAKVQWFRGASGCTLGRSAGGLALFRAGMLLASSRGGGKGEPPNFSTR